MNRPFDQEAMDHYVASPWLRITAYWSTFYVALLELVLILEGSAWFIAGVPGLVFAVMWLVFYQRALREQRRRFR